VIIIMFDDCDDYTGTILSEGRALIAAGIAINDATAFPTADIRRYVTTTCSQFCQHFTSIFTPISFGQN